MLPLALPQAKRGKVTLGGVKSRVLHAAGWYSTNRHRWTSMISFKSFKKIWPAEKIQEKSCVCDLLLEISHRNSAKK